MIPHIIYQVHGAEELGVCRLMIYIDNHFNYHFNTADVPVLHIYVFSLLGVRLEPSCVNMSEFGRLDKSIEFKSMQALSVRNYSTLVVVVGILYVIEYNND